MDNVFPQEHWLPVYTLPRREKQVDRLFRMKQIKSYLPLVKEKHQWKDRKKWVEVPLFRSYVFARVPLTDSLLLLETDGVRYVVRFNGSPAIVPDEQVEGIRRMLEGGWTPRADDYFAVGEEVEIAEGPLAGIRGVLVDSANRSRFIMRVDGLRQGLSIRVSKDLLKRVKRPWHSDSLTR